MASDESLGWIAGESSVEVGTIVDSATVSACLRTSCVVDDGSSE